MTIQEITCKSALARCGFPIPGLAINPYAGCAHACVYCVARSLKRPKRVGQTEKWGTFIDIWKNIPDVLAKQMKSSLWKGEHILLGTLTDPYQPLELRYGLTRKILGILCAYDNPVSIFTKSNMIVRDSDLLKNMKRVTVNITITTLDEAWEAQVEPQAPSGKRRLDAIKILSDKGIPVVALISPYWPIFTDPDALLFACKNAGATEAVSESFNVVSGNWAGVESVLHQHYPDTFHTIHDIFFNKSSFSEFYNRARGDIERAAQKYDIPLTAYFGLGYAKKRGK